MDLQSMPQRLAFIRLTVADRPLWLFLACLLALLALDAAWRRVRGPAVAKGGAARGDGSRPGAVFVSAAAALVLATYLGLMVWYIGQESYYDSAEPTVAAVAWLFELGRPIYHGFDAPERYAHIYGPLAFMLPGAFLALAGPGIAASKAVGVLAALAGLGALWRLGRSASGPRDAWWLTGAFAALCLMYRNMSFWIRPDTFLLCVASASLLAATARRRAVASAATGVCIGLLFNLKITGPCYALPALALLAVRFGPGALAPAVLAAACVAALPFAAFANVSLDHYLLWIRMSAKNGLMLWMLQQNVEWALFLLAPLAPTLLVAPPDWLGRRGRTWFYGALAIGLAAVAAAAAKPGAGAYHLMPFWPVVLYAIALHIDGLRQSFRTVRLFRAGRLAFAATVLLIAVTQQIYFLAYTTLTSDVAGVDDLRAVLHAHPARSIAMGYAQQGERLTFVRPMLVFERGEYPLDAPAVQEYQLSGIALPAATMDALRRCAVDLWLFPLGARPFEGPNRYPATGHAPLFPATFTQTFVEHYAHTADSRYFQIWSCRDRTGR